MALRVLHLDSGRDWRGGQRQVFLLARGLRSRGVSALVVGQPDAPLVRRLRTAGEAAAALRMRADWDLVAARRLRTQIRAWRPDIVHAHDARAHAIAMTALLGLRDLPLIVTRRVVFPPRGRVKYGPRVSQFIAISQAVRQALSSANVPESRIRVVYSGVPTPAVGTRRDWRQELSWPADSVVCGIVGAMSAEKGLDALRTISARMSDDARRRARLVLLGGHAAGRSVVEGLDVFRAGFIDDIHGAMAGLDVLWHPSTSEGLGTSLIDSMALRVPPVAFRVGGIPELIVPDRTGILVPPGDLEAFADAASRLVLDPALRQRLGDAGPVRAAEFSVDAMIDGTLAVYQDVLARQP